MNKRLSWFLCIALTCLSMTNCQKELTLEERKAKLEAEISNEVCKELTIEAINKVMTDISSVDFQDAGATIDENYRIGDISLYAKLLSYGECKGRIDGKDTIYSFYFYGNIPEGTAYGEEKAFDEEGYNLSLKKDGWFVYNNKGNVDSLNNERRIMEKRMEEFERKKKEQSTDKITDAIQKEWKSTIKSSDMGLWKYHTKNCYVLDVRIDDIKDDTIQVSYTLMSKNGKDEIESVRYKGAELTKCNSGNYMVLSIGTN